MTSFSIRPSISRRSSVLLLLLVILMAALLILVTSLQYRWAKEQVAATEIRIGTHIESVLVDWHWDFYRQFSAICVALQVGPDAGAFDDWDAYRSRYIRWKEESPYPDLVRDLYIWETSEPLSPRLLKLGAGSRLPEPVSVTPELEALLDRLKSRSANLRTGLQAWQLSTPTAKREPLSPYSSLSGWQFDQDLPALVHPIVHHALPGRSGQSATKGAVDWIVVQLDLQTLRDQILPELTQRYFRNGLYGPLDVMVASSESAPRILYSSNYRGAVPDRNPDAVMNIFGPAPQATEGHLWEAVKNANSIQPQEWHSILAPVWFPVIRYTTQEFDWTLVVWSRAGRLNETIDHARRENLILSIAVPMLLALNMGLIGMSLYRLNRIAHIQMDFVTSISHELRTPLAALLSAGENIRDGVVEKRRLSSYGSIIATQVQQLIRLVDQILIFAASRSGNRKYQKVAFSAVKLVEAVLRSNDDLLRKGGFTAEKRFPVDLPEVMGDPEAVTRCLQNLLVNAVKYSGPSRHIEIWGEQTIVRGRRYVTLCIRDHGIGISQSDIPNIFKPFYRGQSVQAAQIHGTGLGLAVAKRIAEDLGGDLNVESRLGQGSRFSLSLPRAEAAQSEHHQEASHEREHSTC